MNNTTICFNETLCSTQTYYELKSFQPIYIVILLASSFLTLLFTSFATFVIWKKSTAEMRTYKWSILNIIWTSFCLELLLCIWMPVPLFPIFGGYNGGIVRLDSLEVNYVIFLGCLALFVNLLLAFFNFLFYQVLSMRPKIRSTLGSSTRRYLAYYVMTYLCFTTALLTPVWMARTDTYTLESFNKPPNSSLWVLFDIEETFGFDFVSSSSTRLTAFMIILGVELSIYLMAVVSLNAYAWYSLKQTNGVLTAKVLALQRMLYRSFCIQSISSLLSFFMPVVIVVIVLLIPPSPVSSFRFVVGMVFVDLISLYAPIGSLMAIVTIRPYRVYVIDLIFGRMQVHPVTMVAKLNMETSKNIVRK